MKFNPILVFIIYLFCTFDYVQAEDAFAKNLISTNDLVYQADGILGDEILVLKC